MAEWISCSDLASDSVKLSQKVPAGVSCIVGVSRSGLTPASIVAQMLNLPLLSLDQSNGEVVECGNGFRLGVNGSHREIDYRGTAMVIDDTVMTGRSLRIAKRIAIKYFGNVITGVVYANPNVGRKPDIMVRFLDAPHLLEWNIFNSFLFNYVAMDFDGILCENCTPEQDDDGHRYMDFIDNATPKYLPRRNDIELIVTARIEKYREPTLRWLEKHGVKCKRLVMHPASTLEERNSQDICRFKADHYSQWARETACPEGMSVFIESEDVQARRIAGISGRMSACPETRKVYSKGDLQWRIRGGHSIFSS